MEPVPQESLSKEPLPQEPAAGPNPNLKPAAAEPQAASLLKLASRKARVEAAERSEVIAELRGAETARLEMLQDALRPALADIPEDVEMFDMGLVTSEHPRLFIDMIGFVEMGRDRRTYRFIQATRYGRVVMAENERLESIVKAVVDYVARRLVEREKALAADTTLEQAARAHADQCNKSVKAAQAAQPASKPASSNIMVRAFTLLTELIGASVLFGLLALGVWRSLQLLSAGILAWHGHH